NPLFRAIKSTTYDYFLYLVALWWLEKNAIFSGLKPALFCANQGSHRNKSPSSWRRSRTQIEPHLDHLIFHCGITSEHLPGKCGEMGFGDKRHHRGFRLSFVVEV